MSRILTVGLSDELNQALNQRLQGVAVTPVADGEAAVRLLQSEAYGLLVASETAAGLPLPTWLGQVRGALGLDPGQLPAVALLGQQLDAQMVARLVNQLGVGQLLFHPADVNDLLKHASAVLGVALVAPPQLRKASASLSGLWARFREATFKRVGVIEEAAGAVLQGRLTPELRANAEREAHKLRGSLGTFGFEEGARLAAEIDELFSRQGHLDGVSGRMLSEWLVALRAELSAGVGTGPLSEEAAEQNVARKPRILVVDDDEVLAQALVMECEQRGWRAIAVDSPSAARAELVAQGADAVVLDLGFPDEPEGGLDFLAELATRQPPVPAMVLSGKDELVDRLEAARLGAAGYLAKPASALGVGDALQRVLDGRRRLKGTLLAVDDDPSVTAAIEALMTPYGLKVHTLNEPLRFWDVLASVDPDVLVLDVDMPFLSGIELCRVVRQDPRHINLPILFLTARTDLPSIQRMFSVGADDYIPKPLRGPEMHTRIANRLERLSLRKAVAQADALTGAANKAQAYPVIKYMGRLGQRQERPVTLVRLETVGQAKVEELQRLGESLMARFRGVDVVARWDDQEFVVALLDTDVPTAQSKMTAWVVDFEHQMGGVPLRYGLADLGGGAGSLESALDKAKPGTRSTGPLPFLEQPR